MRYAEYAIVLMETANTFLKRLQSREATAQVELRRQYRPKLTNTCEGILQDSATAEQTAEDVIEDFLFEHVDHLRSSSAIAAYLRMAAVRRSVRARDLRNRHREVDELVEARSDPPTHTEASMLDAIDDRAQIEKMLGCMQRLNDRPRHLLRLRYLKGETLEVIGSSVGVSKQYVGRVIKKSLETVRRCMEAA